MILTLFGGATLLAVLGVPLAVALGLAAMIALTVFLPHIPTEIVAQRMISSVDKFPLVAVPLFILAGELMNSGGITARLIDLSRALVGWIKGGLGLVNVASSMFFAGISGSATADAAGIGRVLIPSMKKEGYDGGFAVAVTAASSTIGPILPPSIVMVIYSAMTNLSIGRLFLAGVVPGLLMGAVLMSLVLVYAVRRDYPREPWGGFKSLFRAFLRAAGPLGAPAIILFGVVGGYFGATEAGAIVVAYSLVLGLIYGELTWARIVHACRQTALNVGVILFAITAASIVGWTLAVGRVPQELAGLITEAGDSLTVVFLIVIAVLLIMGLFLDGLAAMVIMVPVFIPITTALGADPIHFAMIVILCIMVGAVTPPVGILLLITCQVGEVPYREAVRTVWPFVAAMLAVVLLITFVPSLTTWLPEVAFQ